MRTSSLILLKETVKEKKNEVGIVICCLFIIAATSFLQPGFIKKLTDEGLLQENGHSLIIFLLLLICSKLLQSICSNIQTKRFGRIQVHAEKKFLSVIIEKLECVHILSYEKYNSYELFNSLKMDLKNITALFGEFTSMVAVALFQMIAGIMGIISVSWKLALIILGVVPLKVLFMKVYSKKQNRILEELLNSDSTFFLWLAECIEGIEMCKFWKKKETINKELNFYGERLFLSEYKSISVDSDNSLISEVLDTCLSALLYGLGGWLVYIKQITVGMLLAVIAYSTGISTSVTLFMNMKYYYSKAYPSIKRMDKFLNEEEERSEGIKENKESYAKISDSLLECRNLFFKYPNSKEPVLNNVSFQIKRGEKVALIGENGVGKSTLLKILCGFYKIERDQVFLYGNDICCMCSQKLRDHVSVVMQVPFLWNGTIQDNIDCNRIHSDLTTIRICKELNILPSLVGDNKLNHVVTTRGGNLSVGEQKRVALARALEKNTEIILLDEVTANMDFKFNQNCISKLFKEKTVIYTTHIDSEIECADRVLYLRGDGSLIELKASR